MRDRLAIKKSDDYQVAQNKERVDASKDLTSGKIPRRELMYRR
jgi:hypothetical protein